MELDETAKKAVRDLGEAINLAIESSKNVVEAIDEIRKLGFEPNLNLRLEIGLQETKKTEAGEPGENFPEDSMNAEDDKSPAGLGFTDEDVRTLRRMKIIVD